MFWSPAFTDSCDGIAVNWKVTNSIQYADDSLLVADRFDGLQRSLNKVNELKSILLKIQNEIA